jgi:hypothetical protein
VERLGSELESGQSATKTVKQKSAAGVLVVGAIVTPLAKMIFLWSSSGILLIKADSNQGNILITGATGNFGVKKNVREDYRYVEVYLIKIFF